MTNMREIRTLKRPTEIRAEDDKSLGTLFGYAAVFGEETVIGGLFREVIAPGAFRKTLQEADVRHLLNHDPNIVLARTKSGTLRLEEREDGLWFEADLNPEDPDAVSVAAKVRRGDIDQSSFAFEVVKEEWEETRSGEMPLRIIREVKLWDTSSVTFPAYPAASTGIRSVVMSSLSERFGWDDDVLAAVYRSIAYGRPIEDKYLEAVKRATEMISGLVVVRTEEGENVVAPTEEGEAEIRRAIRPHSTEVIERPWDGPGEVAKAPNDPAVLRHMHAWVDADMDPELKSAYKFPHHLAGTDTPAVVNAVRNGLSRLPQAKIPADDKPGVERHLRRHLDDWNEQARSILLRDLIRKHAELRDPSLRL